MNKIFRQVGGEGKGEGGRERKRETEKEMGGRKGGRQKISRKFHSTLSSSLGQCFPWLPTATPLTLHFPCLPDSSLASAHCTASTVFALQMASDGRCSRHGRLGE